jgi:transcriptional regulator with XRE-family HTH domain
MTPQETFVTRLRRHRQRNRVSLEEIAAETRVKRELIEALENNDLSEWPRGLYARALIRTYASVVGLDPGDTVDDFCRLFPEGDRRTNGTIRDIAAIVASESEYRDEFHGQDRRLSAGQPPPAPVVLWQMPVTQAARVAWTKLASAAGPYLRTRRAPRTTL